MIGERKRLEAGELELALKNLPGWEVAEGKLHRRYVFRDFLEAWGFMSEAALEVHRIDHHPEWSNVYHTVTIDLVTHDLKGISTWDVRLAESFELLAARTRART